SPHEAIFKNLYRVRPDELSWLLLQLGRSLTLSSSPPKEVPRQTHYQGNFRTDQPAEHSGVEAMESSPPAMREKDGWITVSLTRLVLPPWCCNCGAPTMSTQAFHGFTRLLRLGRFSNLEGAERVAIHVPVCRACQGDTRRRYRKSFWTTFFKVLGMGVSGGFLLGTVIALLH